MLVVDASIAGAAGDVSMHPTSIRCREALMAILNFGHQLAMTAELSAEWGNHQTRFARTWRASMVAKKRMHSISAENLNDLERRLTEHEDEPKRLAAMVKDKHLLEVAIATDKRVLSLDETVRALFREHSGSLTEIRDVCWVNPAHEHEHVTDWLRSGAPANPRRKLGGNDRPASTGHP